MTVKEFCKKYQISPQSVYAKIKRKAAQLNGHITKSGGQLVIDEYAEKILMPRPPDCFLLEKNKNLREALNAKDTEAYNLKYECDRRMKKYENLKNELAEKNHKIENLQFELAEKNQEIENFHFSLSEKNSKIENFKNQLTEKNLKIADYEKSAAALSEENMKLSETVRLLTNEILNRDGRIEKLQNANAELEAAAAKKLFGFSSKKV